MRGDAPHSDGNFGMRIDGLAPAIHLFALLRPHGISWLPVL